MHVEDAWRSASETTFPAQNNTHTFRVKHEFLKYLCKIVFVSSCGVENCYYRKINTEHGARTYCYVLTIYSLEIANIMPQRKCYTHAMCALDLHEHSKQMPREFPEPICARYERESPPNRRFYEHALRQISCMQITDEQTYTHTVHHLVNIQFSSARTGAPQSGIIFTRGERVFFPQRISTYSRNIRQKRPSWRLIYNLLAYYIPYMLLSSAARARQHNIYRTYSYIIWCTHTHKKPSKRVPCVCALLGAYTNKDQPIYEFVQNKTFVSSGNVRACAHDTHP